MFLKSSAFYKKNTYKTKKGFYNSSVVFFKVDNKTDKSYNLNIKTDVV